LWTVMLVEAVIWLKTWMVVLVEDVNSDFGFKLLDSVLWTVLSVEVVNSVVKALSSLLLTATTPVEIDPGFVTKTRIVW
ncbi:21268_t:CDS:2, partial [Racocetra persica]